MARNTYSRKKKGRREVGAEGGRTGWGENGGTQDMEESLIDVLVRAPRKISSG